MPNLNYEQFLKGMLILLDNILYNEIINWKYKYFSFSVLILVVNRNITFRCCQTIDTVKIAVA